MLLALSLCACSSPTPIDTAPPVITVPCDADSDCDNGLPCDGSETCKNQLCVTGAPMSCDDEIACTTDSCSNELGTCLYLPKDTDRDGHADESCLNSSSVPYGDDCDDEDSARFPGNLEVCDDGNHDEDCDGNTFGNVDADSDEHFDIRCCNGATCGDDCDDLRDNIHPGLIETCDGVDNDCDGVADDGVAVTLFADLDGDGFGNAAAPVSACAGTPRTSTLGTDCDDTNRFRYPALIEVCDGIDNDCDDVVDDGIPNTATWYPDVDGDGFGALNGATIQTCVPPANYSLLPSDCDDARAAVSPVGAELCDGLDNDCNGRKDFVVGVNNFEDDDDDGLLDSACVGGTDCDDKNPVSGPGNSELCDGRDNDCDTYVDEDVADILWYKDLDNDGFGSEVSGTLLSCRTVIGYVATGGDCSDQDATRAPDAPETCNEKDDDCDQSIDEETNFNSDPSNCGACGATCTGPNLTGVCSAGACTCAPARGNCDENLANGCETNILTSMSHCGGCSRLCVLPGAVSTCNSGLCEPDLCIPGRLDCNGNPSDGCEAQESVTQCGGCLPINDCNGSVVHAGGITCEEGRCDFSTCQLNYASCDGIDENGCEVDTTIADNHCGACGNNCATSPNSNGDCVNKVCGCNVGFCNADGQNGNGCELNLSNPTTCGSSCAGATANCVVPNQNGMPMCSGGACTVACDSNRYNCNGDLACETAAGTLQNCGGCGDICDGGASQHGTALCVQETVGMYECRTLCEFGYADCDGDSETCEANVKTDEQNCGACGVTCGSGSTCENGACSGSSPAVAFSFTNRIAVGRDFTCAINGQKNLQCFGSNNFGQLGTSEPSATTSLIDFIQPVTGVYAGDRHACATVADTETTDVLYCWGLNLSFQVGPKDGDDVIQTAQQVVNLTLPRDPNQSLVALGGTHSCAIDTALDVRCWGDNFFLQYGMGSASVSTPIITQTGPYANIHAGNRHVCGNKSGVLYCWGGKNFGQVGDNDPQPFTGKSPPHSLGFGNVYSAGEFHTCRIGATVTECWGSNQNNRAGVNVGSQYDVPQAITAGSWKADLLFGYARTTCGWDQGVTQLQCFGGNDRGQLGRNDNVLADTHVPSAVALPIAPGYVAGSGAFAAHNCVIAGSGLLCWGDNSFGQLGRPADLLAHDNPAESPVSGFIP